MYLRRCRALRTAARDRPPGNPAHDGAESGPARVPARGSDPPVRIPCAPAPRPARPAGTKSARRHIAGSWRCRSLSPALPRLKTKCPRELAGYPGPLRQIAAVLLKSAQTRLAALAPAFQLPPCLAVLRGVHRKEIGMPLTRREQ